MVSADLIERLADSDEEVLELLQAWPPRIEDGVLYFNCQSIHDAHQLTEYVTIMLPTMAEVTEKVVYQWEEESPYHPTKQIRFDVAPLVAYRRYLADFIFQQQLDQ